MESVKSNEEELTSTMGNLLSTSKDDKSDASDSTPTSSTDAFTTTSTSLLAADDPISSTSSDVLDAKKSTKKVKDVAQSSNISNNMSLLKDVSGDHSSSPIVSEKDLLDMNITDTSTEKITENVDDIVQDLENLLGEPTTSFDFTIKSKDGKRDSGTEHKDITVDFDAFSAELQMLSESHKEIPKVSSVNSEATNSQNNKDLNEEQISVNSVEVDDLQKTEEKSSLTTDQNSELPSNSSSLQTTETIPDEKPNSHSQEITSVEQVAAKEEEMQDITSTLPKTEDSEEIKSVCPPSDDIQAVAENDVEMSGSENTISTEKEVTEVKEQKDSEQNLEEKSEFITTNTDTPSEQEVLEIVAEKLETRSEEPAQVDLAVPETASVEVSDDTTAETITEQKLNEIEDSSMSTETFESQLPEGNQELEPVGACTVKSSEADATNEDVEMKSVEVVPTNVKEERPASIDDKIPNSAVEEASINMEDGVLPVIEQMPAVEESPIDTPTVSEVHSEAAPHEEEKIEASINIEKPLASIVEQIPAAVEESPTDASIVFEVPNEEEKTEASINIKEPLSSVVEQMPAVIEESPKNAPTVCEFQNAEVPHEEEKMEVTVTENVIKENIKTPPEEPVPELLEEGQPTSSVVEDEKEAIAESSIGDKNVAEEADTETHLASIDNVTEVIKEAEKLEVQQQIEEKIKEFPENKVVEKIQMEAAVEETATETAGKAMHLEGKLEEVPLGGAKIAETPVRATVETAVEETPIEAVVEETQQETAVKKTQMEAIVEETPMEAAIEKAPIEGAVKETPIEAAVKETQRVAAVEEAPIEAPVETEMEVPVEKSPVEAAVKETPMEATFEEIPLEAAFEEVPVEAPEEPKVEPLLELEPQPLPTEISESQLITGTSKDTVEILPNDEMNIAEITPVDLIPDNLEPPRSLAEDLDLLVRNAVGSPIETTIQEEKSDITEIPTSSVDNLSPIENNMLPLAMEDVPDLDVLNAISTLSDNKQTLLPEIENVQENDALLTSSLEQSTDVPFETDSALPTVEEIFAEPNQTQEVDLQDDNLETLLAVASLQSVDYNLPPVEDFTPSVEENSSYLPVEPKVEEAIESPVPELVRADQEQNEENKLNEPLVINIDDTDKDRVYSPKITIKPIKPPEEEEAPSSGSGDIESTKGSLKMTITKQSDNMHSILKIYDPSDDRNDEPTIPKLIIKPIVQPDDQSHSPKISTRSSKVFSPSSSSNQRSASPRITIKPIPKPEEAVAPLKITIKPVHKADENYKQKHSPKLTIKPVLKPEEESSSEAKVHSPRVTIKPIVKPPEEVEQVSSPRITIKPIVKPTETEPVTMTPRVTIKPVVKPDKEGTEQVERSSPKITIKPIVKHPESECSPVEPTEKSSPKITIKPIVKPQEPEVLCEDFEESIKERIVLKINKGVLPGSSKECRKRDEEKLAKIKLKFSKEGGHPQIVQDASPPKRQRMDTEFLPGVTITPIGPSPQSKLKEMLSRNDTSEKIVTIDDDDDDVTVVEEQAKASPIVISEESNQDSMAAVVDFRDPISEIPIFEITPDSVKTLNPQPVVEVAAALPPAPRKRGRPRKVPLQVREDFKDPKEDEPKPVVESTRPKRSCRGQSVRTTLGIKPRKPRGPGRGRGSKRGMGSRSTPTPPATPPRAAKLSK